jgi:hypothetical protein
VGQHGPVPLPKLGPIVERSFPREWQTDQRLALELTIKRAIERLEGSFGNITKQEAALRLFNLDDKLRFPHVERLIKDVIISEKDDGDKLYSPIRTVLVEKAGLGRSDQNIRKRISGLRYELAIILAGPAFVVMAASSPPNSRDPQLISRTEDLNWLHATYRGLVDSGGGVFLLWGLVGMGKTTLARQFAKEIELDGPVGFIRIGRRVLYDEDLQRVLRIEGQDLSGHSVLDCESAFRRVIRAPTRLRLIIFDGVTDLIEVRKLMPTASTVPVLITSDELLSPSGEEQTHVTPSSALWLDGCDEEASRSYISARLPNIEPETRGELQEVLHNHPATLRLVTDYLLSDGALDVNEFLRELRSQPVRALHGVEKLVGIHSSAGLAVQSILSRFAPDSLELAVLDAMLWVPEGDGMPREFLVELLTEIHGDPPLQTELRAAISQLECGGLLAADDKWLGITPVAVPIVRTERMCALQATLRAYEALAVSPQGDMPGSLLGHLREEFATTQLTMDSLGWIFRESNSTWIWRIFMLDSCNWLLTSGSNDRRTGIILRFSGDKWRFLAERSAHWVALGEVGFQIMANICVSYLDELARHRLSQTTDAEARQEIQDFLDEPHHLSAEELNWRLLRAALLAAGSSTDTISDESPRRVDKSDTDRS